MPELIDSLKRNKETKLTKEDELLLRNVSAATIDRLLAPARKGLVPTIRPQFFAISMNSSQSYMALFVSDISREATRQFDLHERLQAYESCLELCPNPHPRLCLRTL